MATRRRNQTGEGAAKGLKGPDQGRPRAARRKRVEAVGQRVDDEGEPAFSELLAPRRNVEQAKISPAANKHEQHRDRVYRELRKDAQACARAMRHSPLLGDPGEPEEFEDIVTKSLDDYRSGRSLMDHFGADRLLDPATTGMLLGLRRALIEETGAATLSELVLVDMAVIAFANAMRIQSMVGNISLITEAELFGQPTLRAKWKDKYGFRPQDVDGLEVDEQVAKLRERLLPLAERFCRMARGSLEALGKQRDAPSPAVERAPVRRVVLV